MRRKNETNKMAKEYIVTALISLMKKEDYATITITEIAEKAGVSRMAYYRNYTSKDDILNTYIDEVGNSIRTKIMNDVGFNKIYNYFYAIFEQLGLHGDMGVAICNAHLGEMIRDHIKNGMRKTFAAAAGDDEEVNYYVAFLAGAIYSLYVEWLHNGQKTDVAKLADICCRITKTGCASLFGEKAE